MKMYYAFIVNPAAGTGFALTTMQKPTGPEEGEYSLTFADLSEVSLVKVFYLDKSTGEQYQGWKTIDGYKYYFNDGGHSGTAIGERLTGFKNVYGVSYYFADYRCKSLPTGARATGWKVIGGNKYYFKDSKYTGNAAYGQMLTGAKYIGGKAYYFNKSGVCTTMGSGAYFWTADVEEDSRGKARTMFSSDKDVGSISVDPSFYLAVRCVAGAE